MKLKAIAAIFKKSKYCRIWYMPSGEQWITNGVGVYSIDGMPTLKPAALLKIFDIPEDKQAEWNCEAEPMPDDIRKICDDYKTAKIPLEPKETRVQYNGVTHLLLSDEAGSEIIPIDEKYIKPLYDNMEYLRYFKCKLKNGFAVILYDALNVQAVILPHRVGGKMADELSEIARYFNSTKYRMIADGVPESAASKIDSETGEVLNDTDYKQEMFDESEGGGDE
ncbi:MAG: hypothetical protein NC299_09020 [Lachnospiraceae bacterium]|nr:hypothetical protein [Lachnospiraceae bacterium]